MRVRLTIITICVYNFFVTFIILHSMCCNANFIIYLRMVEIKTAFSMRNINLIAASVCVDIIYFMIKCNNWNVNITDELLEIRIYQERWPEGMGARIRNTALLHAEDNDARLFTHTCICTPLHATWPIPNTLCAAAAAEEGDALLKWEKRSLRCLLNFISI